MKANFQELGGTKLWVPAPDKTQSQTGATFTVFLKHSELLGPEISAQERYWQLLQEVPVVNAVGVFAEINGILSLAARDPDAHKSLHERFIEPYVAERVSAVALNRPAFPVVFNRVGNVAAMRDLLIYGGNKNVTTEAPITAIGELALCANEFIRSDPIEAKPATNLDLAAQFADTWDLYNVRDLAYALARMYAILSELLPGYDAIVATLREKIGLTKSASTRYPCQSSLPSRSLFFRTATRC